jgi:hypothetical protein
MMMMMMMILIIITITKLEWRNYRRFSAWTIGSCVEILTRIPAQRKSSAFGGTRLLRVSLLKYRMQFWRHPLFLSRFFMNASLTVPQWHYFYNLQLSTLNTNLYQNDECYSWQNMSYTVTEIYRTEFLCYFKWHLHMNAIKPRFTWILWKMLFRPVLFWTVFCKSVSYETDVCRYIPNCR